MKCDPCNCLPIDPAALRDIPTYDLRAALARCNSIPLQRAAIVRTLSERAA